MTRTLVVIPARWGSTRLPGKPMARIDGRTLLERTVDLGRRAIVGMARTDLVVATDDDRIVRHAQELGCEAVLTATDLSTGSARALAAARMAIDPPTHVVSLQGDAPFLPADTVRAVIDRLVGHDEACVTPVVRLTWADLDALRAHKQVAPASGTTCVRAPGGRALWFSKQILPFLRDEALLRQGGAPCPVLRHAGLYGYRLETLEAFHASPPSAQERLEGLEQLRLLELGIPIQTVLVEGQQIEMGGIDTPADIALAERLIAARGDPFGG